VAVADFSLFLLTLFFVFLAVFVFYTKFFSCKYVQVCKLIYYSKDGPKMYDIDCDLVYSRAKNTTGAELTRVACSDEVLSILENMTNLSLKGRNKKNAGIIAVIQIAGWEVIVLMGKLLIFKLLKFSKQIIKW